METTTSKGEHITRIVEVVQTIADDADWDHNFQIWESPIEALHSTEMENLSEEQIHEKMKKLIQEVRKYVTDHCKTQEERFVMEITLRKAIARSLEHPGHINLSKADIIDWFLSDKPITFEITPAESVSKNYSTKELDDAVKTTDPIKMNRAIQNLLINSQSSSIRWFMSYSEAIQKIISLVDSDTLPQEQKILLLVEVAIHGTAGDNAAMHIFEKFKHEKYMKDPRVETAFRLMFQEMTIERNKHDRYSNPVDSYGDTTHEKLNITRISESTSLEWKDIQLMMHPFFDYMQSQDQQDQNLSPSENFEKFILDKFNDSMVRRRGSGKKYLQLLSIMDNVEEYQFLKNRNESMPIVFGLPKSSQGPKWWTEHTKMVKLIALLNDIHKKSKEPNHTFYLETQWPGNGFLYPEDVRLLKDVRHVEIAGGYAGKCINNALSDLPRNVHPHPIAVSMGIEYKEPWNALRDEEKRQNTMDVEDKFIKKIQDIADLVPEKWFSSFLEILSFYEKNAKTFQEYNTLFTPILLKKTIEIHEASDTHSL